MALGYAASELAASDGSAAAPPVLRALQARLLSELPATRSHGSELVRLVGAQLSAMTPAHVLQGAAAAASLAGSGLRAAPASQDGGPPAEAQAASFLDAIVREFEDAVGSLQRTLRDGGRAAAAAALGEAMQVDGEAVGVTPEELASQEQRRQGAAAVLMTGEVPAAAPPAAPVEVKDSPEYKQGDLLGSVCASGLQCLLRVAFCLLLQLRAMQSRSCRHLPGAPAARSAGARRVWRDLCG